MKFGILVSFAVTMSVTLAAPADNAWPQNNVAQPALPAANSGPAMNTNTVAPNVPFDGLNDQLVEQIKADPAFQNVMDFLIQTVVAALNQHAPHTPQTYNNNKDAQASDKEEGEEEEGAGEEA